MILAAIGTIDGNDHALQDALAAIDEAGIHTILHTGNAVAGARGGNAVIDALHARGVICAQGNTDRLVVRYVRKRDSLDRKIDPDTLAAVREASESLSSQHLEFLRDWRKTHTITLEGLRIFLCHGSPGNPREILSAATPLVKLQRQREIARADIVVCGGSPHPDSRFVDGTLFVFTAPVVDAAGRAQFTLIDTEREPWTASIETAAEGGHPAE